jgi:hypothetical protein
LENVIHYFSAPPWHTGIPINGSGYWVQSQNTSVARSHHLDRSQNHVENTGSPHWLYGSPTIISLTKEWRLKSYKTSEILLVSCNMD